MKFITDNSIYRQYRSIFLEQDENDGEDHSGQKLTPEEFEKFKFTINKARSILYSTLPYFGVILLRLKTVPTYDIPTMAVDNNGNIYINPDFAMNQLSFNEVVGVLAHEAFHHLNLTFPRQGSREGLLWNVATDYIMNRDLVEIGVPLPKLGLIPVNKNDRWIIPQLGNLDITDMTCEQLYDEIVKQRDAYKKILDKLSQHQQTLDKHIEPGEEKPESSAPSTGGKDDDEFTPNAEAGKSETQKNNEAKARAAGAVNEVQSRSRGSGSGTPRSFDPNMYKPKTNWRLILKEFIKSQSGSRYDWSKPNKRALGGGYYSPKLTKEVNTIEPIVIAIDTSGSMSEEQVNAIMSELINLLKTFKAKVRVLFWTTEVYLDVEVDSLKERPDVIKKRLTGLKIESGGTYLSSVKQYLDSKQVRKINGLLVFTDGQVESTPQLPISKQNIFLLVGASEDDIVKKYGKTYQIEIGT